MPLPSAPPRKLKGEMAPAGSVERLRTIKAQDNQLHGSAKRTLSSTAVVRGGKRTFAAVHAKVRYAHRAELGK